MLEVESESLLVLRLGLGIFWLCPAVLSALKSGVPYNPGMLFQPLCRFSLFCAWHGRPKRATGSSFPVGLYVVGAAVSLYNYFLVPAYGRDDIRAAAQFVHGLQPSPERSWFAQGFVEKAFLHYYSDPVPIKAVIQVSRSL
jgi:hypothetical protein